MDYLVTGGAGYIGGHLVDTLLLNKQDVTVIDDFSSGKYVNKKANTIRFDLRKQFLQYKKLKLDYPTIVHLAANPDVKSSMTDVMGHSERDVTATLNTMELARNLDASNVIFSSTSAVYGNAKKIPTPETYELSPISNYGMFKVLGEDILKYYAENYGIRSVALRFANVTGGRMSHGIMCNFVNQLKKKKPVEVWGDGRQSKSYVYITDLINAMLLLGNKSKKTFDAFNIGNKDSCSVVQILEIFKSYAGKDFPAKYTKAQEGDVRNMLLDIAKIKSLGWTPKYSSSQAISMSFSDLLAKSKK